MSAKYLTPIQVAKRYGVHYRTVLGWIEDGSMRAIELPSHSRYGVRYRILETELAVFDEMRSNRRSRSDQIVGARKRAASRGK